MSEEWPERKWADGWRPYSKEATVTFVAEETALLGFRRLPSMRATIAHKMAVIVRAIKAQHGNHGFKIRGLAKELNVGTGTAGRWITGLRVPYPKLWVNLDNAYERAIEKLLIYERKKKHRKGQTDSYRKRKAKLHAGPSVNEQAETPVIAETCPPFDNDPLP